MEYIYSQRLPPIFSCLYVPLEFVLENEIFSKKLRKMYLADFQVAEGALVNWDDLIGVELVSVARETNAV